MTHGQLELPLWQVRHRHAAQLAEDETDQQLLERFVAQRAESSFAALVARHWPGVLGVCRRVLRHEQDAEDAAQAAFLVLARKAGLVRWQPSVKRWLHAVAYRVAIRARGSLVQRRLREKMDGTWDHLPENSHPQADSLAEVGQRELQQVVADELTNLPQKYHAPLILCYLEGKTNEEAADQLGWPSGSISGRLARARDLLRQRLLRRGFALIVFLVGMSAAVLWGRWSHSDGLAHGPVARLMTPFRPVDEGGKGIESELHRLAEKENPPDRERLASLARQTALVADSLQVYAPEERQSEWRKLAHEMRASALDLASALEAREDKATVLAARTLSATCQKCHLAFRD